jgi:hypothetical protein
MKSRLQQQKQQRDWRMDVSLKASCKFHCVQAWQMGMHGRLTQQLMSSLLYQLLANTFPYTNALLELVGCRRSNNNSRWFMGR